MVPNLMVILPVPIMVKGRRVPRPILVVPMLMRETPLRWGRRPGLRALLGF